MEVGVVFRFESLGACRTENLWPSTLCNGETIVIDLVHRLFPLVLSFVCLFIAYESIHSSV